MSHQDFSKKAWHPYFSSHIALSLFLFFLGLGIFALTTYSLLTKSLLYPYEKPVHDTMTTWRYSSPNWALSIANGFDYVGNVGTGVISFGLVVYWLWRKQIRKIILLLVTVAAGFLVFLALAFLFDRTRPQEVGLLKLFPLPGYPSGHVMIVVVLYALLLYLYLPKIHSDVWRTGLILFALVLTVIIGFLRLYENAHFLLDVIAGFGVGLSWVVLAIFLLEWYYLRRDV